MITGENLIGRLRERHLRIATAESCTGGLLAGALTDISGASAVFDCGIVSYSNEIKTRLLDVEAEIIAAHGAVSRETALAMAQGVRMPSGADLALATTGIAGPGGGTKDKPVGLVYIALADRQGTIVEEHHFIGDRTQIRRKTVDSALVLLDNYLNN
jgi:PncC family amidohydrolase